MTGVACNEIGNPSKYTLKNDCNWGYRKCILGDLSPFASFITANYTHRISKQAFRKAANEIYKKLYEDLSWTYSVKDDDDVLGKAMYYIWSEVQSCPSCGEEFTYWDAAVNFKTDEVLDEYPCPHCGSLIKKNKSIKAFATSFDSSINETHKQVKYVPVIVNYVKNGKRKERKLNDYDLELIRRTENEEIPYWFPKDVMREGDETHRNDKYGITHVHQFYTRRNLLILSHFYGLIQKYNCNDRLRHYLMVWFTSCQSRLHLMNRYAAKHHRHVGPLANTLYISGTPTEISPFYFIKSKIDDNSLDLVDNHNVVNQVASATSISIPDNSIDYIFTDPPFGGNIMYAELNFIYESWLKVYTDIKKEAITNKKQHKGNHEYEQLMYDSFKEYYRVLKPGKWMTIEFSNTSSAIWNAIRMAIQNAGFVIAFVSDLNKGRGGLHGIYNVVSVNQDLAISCFKPSQSYFSSLKSSVASSWDFIDDYLSHLPVHISNNDKTDSIIERSPKILYDRLISYCVVNGKQVPMDAQDFQQGLRERYVERDGMFFTATQASDYEMKRSQTVGFAPMGIIVSDEANGIQWLKNYLRNESKTYQEIQPEWLQAIGGVRKNDILPELMQLLEENFIEEADGRWRLPNVHDNKDVETLRTKALLREFKVYVEAARKPKGGIRTARVEALRAGFRHCYAEKDFGTIVAVGDKIPQNLLTEDEVLLQLYDIAQNKV